MAGIMDMFRGTNGTSNQTQQQNQQQQNQNQNQQNNQQQNNQQGDPTKKNDPENQKNPLDIYNGLYDNANRKDAITAPTLKLDSAKIKEIAATMDFTRNVNPELLAKAQGGDTMALIQIINDVGRSAYASSIEHNTALTDHHLSSRSTYEDARIADSVKRNLTANEFASSTPNFQHPVLKTELNRIASQLASMPENADATPQQIAKKAQEYLTSIVSAMNPQSGDGQDNKGYKFDPMTGKPLVQQKEMDWAAYLGTESSTNAQ